MNNIWEEKYSKRRLKTIYQNEDNRDGLFPNGVSIYEYLKQRDRDNLISTFLNFEKDHLDTPSAFRYSLLKEYLSNVSIDDIWTSGAPTGPSPDMIILDERQDPTAVTARVWDSDHSPDSSGSGGYLTYPTFGTNTLTEKVDIQRLVRELTANRCQKNAERRTIYIADMTASCMMAISATAATRWIPKLRNFFHHYLLFRTLFRVSLSASFSLEFHIPYFALRPGSAIPDKRTLQDREFRAHQLLPLERDGEGEAYYYEAQISFLMIGVDEWFWTTYCCVDTFFGSETGREAYLNPHCPTDAASGGSLLQKYPVWNPRQYFLAVLSRRMLQARYEWTTLVECYINRLSTYERSFEMPDDAILTRTTELTAAVATLRQFTNLLASTIKTCKNFQSDYISLFDVGSVKLMDWWQGYITSFGDSILELETLHMIMSQKLELFNSMPDGLASTSTLSESTQEIRQADNIGILTKMTIPGTSTNLSSPPRESFWN